MSFDLSWRVLGDYVERAVFAHRDPHVREVMFRQLSVPGYYRIMSSVRVAVDGDVPDADTLVYVVQLATTDGGWATLCDVDARLLPLSEADIAYEIASLLAQQRPVVIPDDCSEIAP
jgi:hypothetical protein